MPIQADQDLDLVTTSLKWLGEYHWTDDVSTLQRHIFINYFFKKHKAGFQAGPSLQWNVQITPSNAFRMTGIGAPDIVNNIDLMTVATLPWRHWNTNYGIDGREIAMNRKPRMIVDIMKEKRAGAMISAADGLENQAFSLPGGASDNLNMMGFPFWIVPNATQGFNGGNPFGYAAGAGNISTTPNPNWANYTDQWADPTKLDMIRKMRRAAYFTDFMSPTIADVPSYNTGDDYIILTTYLVLARCEEAAEKQNDNLGNDVASKDGKAVFRRNPIIGVPILDQKSGQGMSGTFSNSTYTSSGGYAVNPIFGVNCGVFKPIFLEGWYMREKGPFPLNGIQHTMYAVQVDGTVNLICYDRRRNWGLTQ